MKAHLTRRYMFSASHRLHSDEMSTRGEPRDLRQVQQSLRAWPQLLARSYRQRTVDPQTGMVCNLVDLDGFVQPRILERYDHQNLNLLAGIRKGSSNHGKPLHRHLRYCEARLPQAHLEKVRIEETMMNSFEYLGEEA